MLGFCVTPASSLSTKIQFGYHIHICLPHLLTCNWIVCVCVSGARVRSYNSNSTGTLPVCLRTNARLQIANYALPFLSVAHTLYFICHCHFMAPLFLLLLYFWHENYATCAHTVLVHTLSHTQKMLISNDDCTVGGAVLLPLLPKHHSTVVHFK